LIALEGDRLASAAGAEVLAGDAPGVPHRAVIDSREVREGDLFVGLRGGRFDGGQFAGAALRQGAWGVLVGSQWGRELAAQRRVSATEGSSWILGTVDPLASLQSLARAWREELGCRVIGITGSTGKTSVKDVCRVLLPAEVHASPENFNTEIGLPLAVLAAPEGTDVLVLEMGMRGPGQIAELSHRTLKRDFRRIDTSRARIILLDAAPNVLGAFGEDLGVKATDKLKQIGVEVQLGAKVVNVDATGIEVEDANGQHRRIESVCKVWAAGVQASELGAQLAEQSGAEVDRAGRVLVNDDLTLPGHPEVFVVGDMASLKGYPGVAQVAIQGARYAAEQIKRRLAGQEPSGPFEYHDKGSMATISRFSAVASIGRLRFSGFSAWVLWLAIHLVYIIGFKHRLTTLLHWAVSFVGRGRSERTVTEQQTFARNAIDQLGEGFAPSLPRVASDRQGPPRSVAQARDQASRTL
jgi:hypothetical protein